MRATEFITEQPLDDITLQRALKFGAEIDADKERNPGAFSMTGKATRDLIAKARAQEKSQRVTNVPARAHDKDGVHKQGFKPVTFPKSNSISNVKMAQFDDVQAAIREHVKQGIPFTECMFRAGSPAFTEFYRQVREVADKLNLDWQDQELLTTDIGECIMVEGELVPLDVPMEELELDEAQFDTTGLKLVKKQDGIELWKSLTDPNEVVAKIPGTNTVWDGYWDGSEWELEARSGRHGVIYIDNLDKLFEDLKEAEYQGRKVKLNSPKRGGSKKFYVYVKNPKTGRVKKISWGDTTGLSVKAKDRGAVRSFVARHKCKQANDKMTARYWSCRTPRYKALGVKGGQWW